MSEDVLEEIINNSQPLEKTNIYYYLARMRHYEGNIVQVDEYLTKALKLVNGEKKLKNIFQF